MSWAIRLSKVLVATGSPELASLLKQMLAPRSEAVLTATDVAEGLQHVARHADLGLVLCDVALPGGDGLRLLEFVRSIEEPTPQVVLFAARRDDAQARRALELGAIALLAQPISFDDIAAALLAPSWSASDAPRASLRRPGARAAVLESGPEAAASPTRSSRPIWHVRELSRSGAFLETAAPLPVGLRVELALQVGSREVRVTAEVVRNQTQSWDQAAGVWIRFLQLQDDAAELIAACGDGARRC